MGFGSVLFGARHRGSTAPGGIGGSSRSELVQCRICTESQPKSEKRLLHQSGLGTVTVLPDWRSLEFEYECRPFSCLFIPKSPHRHGHDAFALRVCGLRLISDARLPKESLREFFLLKECAAARKHHRSLWKSVHCSAVQ